MWPIFSPVTQFSGDSPFFKMSIKMFLLSIFFSTSYYKVECFLIVVSGTVFEELCLTSNFIAPKVVTKAQILPIWPALNKLTFHGLCFLWNANAPIFLCGEFFLPPDIESSMGNGNGGWWDISLSKHRLQLVCSPCYCQPPTEYVDCHKVFVILPSWSCHYVDGTKFIYHF